MSTMNTTRTSTRENAVERFWRLVDKTDEGCWLWTGTRKVTGRTPGYGSHYIDRETGQVPAHRFSYDLNVGLIPSGFVIDHLCRNPSCVRPDHLEPVDNRTNVIARGTGPLADKSRQTHCVNGHEFTPENTWIRPDSARGTRNCRQCARDRKRAYAAAKRAA